MDSSGGDGVVGGVALVGVVGLEVMVWWWW